MAKFILSGFADEMSPVLDVQMEMMAKLGIRYIEPRTVDHKNISDYTPAEAKLLRKRFDDHGMAVSALGSPIGKIGIKDEFAPHLDVFKRTIEVAQEMGTQNIRLFSFFIPANEDAALYRDEVMERMGAFVEANKGSGVNLLHENEKAIYGDIPERCLDILKTFEGQILCTYDPSNFVQCDVDNKHAFDLLGDRIYYMHIKDSVYKTGSGKQVDHGFEGVSDAHRPAGHGDGCVEYVLSQLVKRNFEGFASIEPHLSNNNNVPGTGADKFTVAANALKALIAKVM